MEKFTRFKYAPLMIFQIILMVLFFVFVTYETKKGADIKGYEDTHVMIFIGFGFLMTFLKKYSYSALGFNWFLAALCIQWALLCQSFYSMENNTIYISKKSLFEADVMSATVLITFGAVLGIASGTQLLLIAIVEIAVGCLNFYIIDEIFEASDVGGSIGIHSFGAYFGLGVSSALRIKKGDVPEASRLDGPNYQSDVTAMIGSLFLWIYWPSFNSALTSNDVEYQRAVINTYLSLAAATVTAFVISSMVSHKKGKFDMVHIQNSTLAGGVAIGAICNLYICPGIAIAVGILAGMLSVLGYRFLTPALEKIGLQDTCGVNNLHGMPGVFSALLSVLFAGLATSATYGTELSNIFPAMMSGRTAGVQALYQLAALGVTLALSYGSGFITGFIAKQPIFDPLKESDRYDDEINWELPTP